MCIIHVWMHESLSREYQKWREVRLGDLCPPPPDSHRAISLGPIPTLFIPKQSRGPAPVLNCWICPRGTPWS